MSIKKASKEATRLKDLPGFEAAFVEALTIVSDQHRDSMLRVGDVVLPGVERITNWHTLTLLAAAMDFGVRSARRRLRLVPPVPRAANDCEVDG